MDIEKEKQELLLEMARKKMLATSFQEENGLMKKYIRHLEREQFSQVKGTPFPSLKTTHSQNKKLKEVKTRSQKALHFRPLFGLELDCLKLKDPDSSKMNTVEFENAPLMSQRFEDSCCSSTPSFFQDKCSLLDTSTSTDQNNLPPRLIREDNRVKHSPLNSVKMIKLGKESILYLIDKFEVGDSLSMNYQ